MKAGTMWNHFSYVSLSNCQYVLHFDDHFGITRNEYMFWVEFFDGLKVLEIWRIIQELIMDLLFEKYGEYLSLSDFYFNL